MIQNNCVREKAAELVFDVCSSAHFFCSIYELFVFQHIWERLAEESNFEIYRKMPILILSQLPVQLVLLLDNHTDHRVVKYHVLGDILLLAQNLNSFLEELGLDEELLHLL
jgi:hypothetical protein